MQPLLTAIPQVLLTALTPKRRDALVFLVGLALLLSPVLVTMGFVGGTEYHYESTEVIESGDGLAYADATDVPAGTPISEDIACAGTQVERACALEQELTDGDSLPLGVSSDDPDRDPAIAQPPYEFVQLDGEIYRAVYNTTDDDSVEVELSSSSAGVALHAVSIDPEQNSVSSTVIEAAEEGEATSRTAAEVPETPVIVDGQYYRVYLVEEASQGATSPLSLGIFFGAALGGILILSLARKVRVSYYPEG